MSLLLRSCEFLLMKLTGKAGNPDVMEGVTMVVGVTTDVIAGEGLILTAGGIDSRILFINNRLSSVDIVGDLLT